MRMAVLAATMTPGRLLDLQGGLSIHAAASTSLHRASLSDSGCDTGGDTVGGRQGGHVNPILARASTR